MCYGWAIFRDGRLVAHGHGAFARPDWASSNSAEYLAMIEGLQALRDMGVQREAVEVIGDARSVIEQCWGGGGQFAPGPASLPARAAHRRHFHNVRWIWQPRRANALADQLTGRALKMVNCNRESTRLALQQALKPRGRVVAPCSICLFSVGCKKGSAIDAVLNVKRQKPYLA